MTKGRTVAWRLCLVCVVLFFSGCVLGDSEPNYEEYTPEELYALGENALVNVAKPERAIQYFEAIERIYPYSSWSKRALLKVAISQHRARKYEEARLVAQRYLEIYPTDPDAPDAAFLVALSYYDQIDDIGRDQEVTINALKAFRFLIETYPDSKHVRSAQLKFELAMNQLAAKEMDVGRYYLKKGFYTAAINRFRIVIEDFQTTSYTAEALSRLVEAYLSLGLDGEAQTAAAILGYNYRSSPFYLDAYSRLEGIGLEPEVKVGGWLASVYRQMVRGEWL